IIVRTTGRRRFSMTEALRIGDLLDPMRRRAARGGSKHHLSNDACATLRFVNPRYAGLWSRRPLARPAARALTRRLVTTSRKVQKLDSVLPTEQCLGESPQQAQRSPTHHDAD